MTLPNMRSITSREYLRIAGGYGAPAEGSSPQGGLDIDNAGNLATDGDVTVKGTLSAGSTPQQLTDAAGLIDGSRIQAGTVDTVELANDAVDATKLDETGDYTVHDIHATGDLDVDGDVTVGNSSAGAVQAHDLNLISSGDANINMSAGTSDWQIQAQWGATHKKLKFIDADSSTTVMQLESNGDAWFIGDVSALSITDRSPLYVGGRALQILEAIKAQSPAPQGEEWAEVDHSTLGPMRVRKTRDEGTVDERNLNKQIQLNTAGILELLGRLEQLETQIGALNP